MLKKVPYEVYQKISIVNPEDNKKYKDTVYSIFYGSTHYVIETEKLRLKFIGKYYSDELLPFYPENKREPKTFVINLDKKTFNSIVFKNVRQISLPILDTFEGLYDVQENDKIYFTYHNLLRHKIGEDSLVSPVYIITKLVSKFHKIYIYFCR